MSVDDERRPRREAPSTKYSSLEMSYQNKFHVSFCDLCILWHSVELYLLFVKNFIVAYDGQLQITLIILWTSHVVFFKSWLISNYIWAPGWATAPVVPVLDLNMPLAIRDDRERQWQRRQFVKQEVLIGGWGACWCKSAEDIHLLPVTHSITFPLCLIVYKALLSLSLHTSLSSVDQ